tara:strand:- start:1315 stop:1695 length:381 start_codon:yes stop_codon:yes gene_type:complete
MAFPSLVPTARTFDAGDFPVKIYRSQNGKEHRILYGSNRTNMKLSLTYANITDANAELFLDHYEEEQGTFGTFDSVPSGYEKGWEGNASEIDAQTFGNKYRYEGPPQVVQVRPGVSTVTVNLIGVL